MARPPRADHPGLWHHVMNRGACQQTTFIDDQDRRFFLELLEEVSERCGVEAHAFALMGNHYHLLMHTPEAGLSEAMRYLSSVYTQRFNSRHQRDGALFRGRFHSVLVETTEQLSHVARYIHRNPLDLSPNIDLVHYPWSSLGMYASKRRPHKWLHRDKILDLYNNQVEWLLHNTLRTDQALAA